MEVELVSSAPRSKRKNAKGMEKFAFLLRRILMRKVIRFEKHIKRNVKEDDKMLLGISLLCIEESTFMFALRRVLRFLNGSKLTNYGKV